MYPVSLMNVKSFITIVRYKRIRCEQQLPVTGNPYGFILTAIDNRASRTRLTSSLDKVTVYQTVLRSHYEGTYTIDIRQIVGSENRSEDFDDGFTRLKRGSRDRWGNIAQAFMQGYSMPPVEVIQIDDEYYVRDGHHRVSVAKTLGQRFIDAEITSMQRKAII